MDASGVRGLLGISGGVVELERFVFAGGGLRGAGDGLIAVAAAPTIWMPRTLIHAITAIIATLTK